jgi:hypothetical protein
MTPTREIVKQYLARLEPDELVALLMEVHGSNSSEYLMILSAEAMMVEARR